MNAVHEHEIALNRIMTKGVKDLPGLSIIGPEDASKRAAFAPFSWTTYQPMMSLCSWMKQQASWSAAANTASTHGLLTVAIHKARSEHRPTCTTTKKTCEGSLIH